VALEIDVAPDVPIIWTDPGKLQQILYNFLANAIKFSPAGSQIDLVAMRPRLPDPDQEPAADSAAEDTFDKLSTGTFDKLSVERILITVTDHGPGIEPDKQQLIFEKFRQVDASHTRSHGGTGLGLAISKELTNLLSGSIGVKSTVGQGSTFWISIPLKIEAGAMDVRGRMAMV
jgi:signal transduction histidine kinase